jgi:vancomycin resistance protein YoaR
MHNQTYPYKQSYRPLDAAPQIMIAMLGGLIVFTCLILAVAIGFNVFYAGQIFPGVSVAGVDLSGLKPDEAASLLASRLDYPQRGRILFKDGEKYWLATPAELGFFLDPQATARTAYQQGRSGSLARRAFSQFNAWYTGFSISPQYIYDANVAQTYLGGIAAQNDIPKIEPSLSVNGATVVVSPGQTGRSLDIPTTSAALQTQLQSMRDGEVPLVIVETPPMILNADEQAEIARQILSQPLTLTLPEAKENDPGQFTFSPEDLAKMLAIETVPSPEGERYQVTLQAEGLRTFLEGIAPQLLRYPQNARFIFNDDTRQLEVIQPSVIGRSLDVDGTIQAINEKLPAGDHKVALDIEYMDPQVGDKAKAKQLGITELVSSYTSYFYGSSGERIQNITTAAGRFHGLLVPPGATFSMSDWLGDVSLDNGYAEALIIFGNRTIQGVGGGVCQVSTTLFRTVFFGGYPVVERYPHAYRVYYYEQTAGGGNDSDMAGLDATVFAPLVDFKFTNDSANWLLMETYVDGPGRTLTWKFYSTSDGREVEWHTTGLRNKEEPPKPLYEENPELGKGEIEQVDWEVEGADVTVTRTVTRGEQVLYDDNFTTHYLPWRAVYQYGPGTEGMPPDEDGKKKKKDNDN